MMHSTLLSEKLGKIRNDEGRTRNHVQDLTAMDVVPLDVCFFKNKFLIHLIPYLKDGIQLAIYYYNN